MRKILILFIFLTLTGYYLIPTTTFSQTACTNQIAGKTRAQLEQELAACEAEMAQWEAELARAKNQSAGFQTDINALTAKINAAQASIKSRNNQIALLTRDIATKQTQIQVLDSRLTQGKKAIADILKKRNEISSYSLVEAMLSEKNLSEFFVDVDTYASTERALATLFAELRDIKDLTEAERQELNKKREAEAAARAAAEAAKKVVEVDQKEKARLLALSKNEEKTYAQEVAERKAKAAQIRAVLFPLRDAGAIPFGTALQYAEVASAKTGVRPAFVLAILQQESNLGANVGSCVITNLNTGETKGVNTGRIFSNGIHPTRDLPLLQTILTGLGRDPLTTRVSCPLSIGYGGAMGPSQFIPSTWNIMIPKIAAATGKEVPDPWNPADAIMASALYLADLGAGSGTQVAERNAACRYYSGRVCANFAPAASYGTQVMSRASNIQLTMIDPLQGL